MFDAAFPNIRYPREAQRSGVSGEVQVAFTIDSEGKTSNHRVIKGVGFGCDEEALKAVKAIPDLWIPGLLSGQAVGVEYVLPVRFNIKG